MVLGIGHLGSPWLRLGGSLVLFLAMSSGAFAQTDPKATAAPAEEDALTKLEKSPWLLAPVFQSNPKLGTAVGALAGYLHYFDAKSRPSIFALHGPVHEHRVDHRWRAWPGPPGMRTTSG